MSGAVGVSCYRPLPAGVRPSRRDWLWPFVIAGACCVIGGGLLAAATAYVSTEKTAWATAYLVLVGGVAQIVLGAGVSWLAPVASRRLAWWSFVLWNVGNAGVLAGQLAGLIALTDAGTAGLVAALVLILVAVRSRHAPERGGGIATDRLESPHPVVLWVFRGVVILLAVTMPIGVILA